MTNDDLAIPSIGFRHSALWIDCPSADILFIHHVSQQGSFVMPNGQKTFSLLAAQSNGIRLEKFDQGAWFEEMKAKKRVTEPSMERGCCLPVAAQWMIAAREHRVSSFNLHMRFPNIQDTLQNLRGRQVNGENNVIDRYLGSHGFSRVNEENKPLLDINDLAQQATTYSGGYIIGLSGPAKSASSSSSSSSTGRSGHALAVHIDDKYSCLFDPNYGTAYFSNSDDLCSFIIDLLPTEQYSDLTENNSLTRYS